MSLFFLHPQIRFQPENRLVNKAASSPSSMKNEFLAEPVILDNPIDRIETYNSDCTEELNRLGRKPKPSWKRERGELVSGIENRRRRRMRVVIIRAPVSSVFPSPEEAFLFLLRPRLPSPPTASLCCGFCWSLLAI